MRTPGGTGVKVRHCMCMNLSTFHVHCCAPQVPQAAHLSKWHNNDTHDCVLNAVASFLKGGNRERVMIDSSHGGVLAGFELF